MRLTLPASSHFRIHKEVETVDVFKCGVMLDRLFPFALNIAQVDKEIDDGRSVSTPHFWPAVFYKDPFAALEWLEKAFGFERSMVITDTDGPSAIRR